MEGIYLNTEKRVTKPRFGLAFKCIIGLGITGICIMIAVAVIGTRAYQNSITKQYNETAYQTAKTAEGYFTAEEIRQYAELTYNYNHGTASQQEIDAVAASQRYQEINARLNHLRESMNANDIFVFVFDVEVLKNYDAEADARDEWKPMYYISDSYRVKESQLHFGDKSSIFQEYIDDSLTACETGIHADNYFISEGDYGYNTSAMYPIVQEGKTIAFIGVEIPMSTLQGDMRSYVINVATVGSVITLCLLILITLGFERTLIRPVKLVADAANQFVMHDNVNISHSLEKVKTRDEIQILSESVLKMEKDINEYIDNLTAVTAERERIGAELSIATQIQADMLPSIFPAFPDRKEIDIYATMTPAKEVGGDFYDFFMVDDRHLAMVIADVSGKGVPAALFMVIGKTLIKDHTTPDASLGDVFTEINNLLCESNKGGLFITAFECVLDLATGELVFVNAGHELPFIRKKDGAYESYKTRAGFVLAGMENIRYRQGSIMLEPGDSLFLYTDGVTEATSTEEELYGMTRLGDILNKNRSKKPEELLSAVKANIDEFVGEAPQFDDITMLALEFRQKKQDC